MPILFYCRETSMPNSMTGFARQLQQADWGEISCEIRSVNHRYLEPSIRLPELLRSLEPTIRENLRKLLQRGKVEVNFQLTLTQGKQQGVTLNNDLLQALINAVAQVKEQYHDTAAADPVRLLQWPGVVEQTTPDTDVIQETAAELLHVTLQALIAHREREGQVLQGHIQDRLTQISALVKEVRAQLPSILSAQKNKLRQRLNDLTNELDENRLEQEIVLIANKADVDEELDRLDTHLVEVGHILNQSGAIGRRLDFMMQELNREANTLSSKSLASETTQIAVSMKVLIEQMREQIQNIE
jgi:uncharacterized protein (TIGR00255 family)